MTLMLSSGPSGETTVRIWPVFGSDIMGLLAAAYKGEMEDCHYNDED